MINHLLQLRVQVQNLAQVLPQHQTPPSSSEDEGNEDSSN